MSGFIYNVQVTKVGERKGRGNKMDTKNLSIEEMNKNKKLVLMSLPIFVELMLQLLVGNIDQIMVSRVSQNSVASIVNANQVMNLVIIVLSMSAAATTIILSQYLGANDKKSASEISMASIAMITIAGIGTTILIAVLHRPLFQFMNVPQEILRETSLYLMIVASCNVVQGIYLVFSAILRAFTLMKEVMFVSIIMNVLNIIGNAILINGWFGLPQLGVVGAGISTACSKVIGMILIFYICKKKVDVPLKFAYLRPFPWKHLRKVLRVAIPSGTESLSYNASQMCILSVVNWFGTWVTTTKGYCSIFANISYVYAMAIGEATQVVLGYLIGSKRFELVKKRVYMTTIIAIITCVGVSTLLFLCGNWIFYIFTDDPRILELGKKILGIEIILELGRAVNIIMTRSLVSVGDIKTPTVVGIIFQWFVALAGSYFFGVFLDMGLIGVWIAMTLDECMRGIIFFIHFGREKWRKNWEYSE